MPAPLLTYLLATDPMPLTTGMPAAPQQGRINAGVFAKGPDVYCDLIRIAVPVGSSATDGFSQRPASSVSTNRWVAESVHVVKGKDIGLDAVEAATVFTFVPRDRTDDKISYPLGFGLLGPVSDAPGPFSYQVQERSGTSGDRARYTLKEATYQLTKNSAQLYLRNLVASTVEKPLVPVTEVAAGTPLRLAWASSGTWFELYAGEAPQPVYRGPATSTQLDAGIVRDTTFFLVASSTGDPSQGTSQGGFQTIYAYATLALTVTHQTLPALTVAGPLSVTATGDIDALIQAHGSGLWGAPAGMVMGTSSSHALSFGTAAAVRMTVSGAGDVGVGTPQPASRLHVNVDRSGTPVHAMQIDVQSFQTADNAKASHFLLVRDVSAGDGGSHFFIRGDGNVGVGTASPGARLQVVGGGGTSVDLLVNGRLRSNNNDGGLWIGEDRLVGGHDTNKIGLYNGNAWRLSVLNNGVVGVGDIDTLQAASRLHVNVGSSGTPVRAMQIDVQSFQTIDNARASHFLLVRDVGAGDGGNHFFIRGDGGVGIGTTNTQNQRLCVQGPTWLKGDLFVNGALVYWWGPDNAWKVINNRAGDWAGSATTHGPNTSDIRLKTDVRPIRHALAKVRQLHGIRYRWGDSALAHFTSGIESSVSAGPDATDEQHRQLWRAERRRALAALEGDHLGLIAQDVERVLPELVLEDDDGYKRIRYQHLTAVLIEAIKEQDAVVTALSAKVATLETGNRAERQQEEGARRHAGTVGATGPRTRGGAAQGSADAGRA